MAEIITIRGRDEAGYGVCIDSAESWVVAVNNAGQESAPENAAFFGAHPDTDETFVLAMGRACIAAAPHQTPENFTVLPMEQGVCYNVRRSTWHTVLMSPGAKVVICENRNPGSERYDLSGEEKNQLMGEAERLLKQ